MSARGHERRVLDEAGGVRAMTYVMGIMLFLTLLAAALGIATLSARADLSRQLAGRLTVQVVAGEPALRDREAARALAALHATPLVRAARAVDPAELARLLRPWLGEDAGDAALPMPAMIDVDLATGADPAVIERIVRAAAPSARVDRHQSWMSPVTSFMSTLAWLAGVLVVLMAAATAAVVVLATRAGLESHRATIEVMHMLGSTDRQVARLFQRRLAIDAALGGVVGGAGALLVIALVGWRIGALGSELLGGVAIGTGGWIALALLPLAFVLLAMASARYAVLARLRAAL